MPVQPLIADRYEIKEILGEGGMGVVYQAIDIKTKSQVALKTMRDVSDPLAVELFSKEWSVLAGLSHPNIVDIRDVGEIDDQGQKKPFFVMPLLPGDTLGKLIETASARLTVERVVAIITQVCRGLQAAHERGLVHRDIKPSNIFVMEDDSAKIIDFGVVHLAGAHSVTGLKGTWQYMAPEQIDMKPASPLSDIFSLGIVCYEALTGRKPFACKTPGETAEAVRRYIPPPISEINPTVSQVISMVIHKAMAKQPNHRFSSARDFGDTLQKASLNQPIPRFERAKIQPRIERAKKSFVEGDSDFASEILTELETEGHIDAEINLLRSKIDQAVRQKRIHHLLESARTRVEQDEIPLALEKLKEVLEIDPENADAHSMRRSVEKQRSARQIESWMSLARRHLERHDFSEARQALMEVLKIRPSDPEAAELLRETERREKDAVRTRDEKEQLYGSAVKAYQNGEVSTALSKLEKLLDLGRQTPDAAVPDRDALYQGFYNQVRSDRDSIHNAYQEARRHLAENNIARALEICDEFIAKYPSDAIFQAFKLEAVEQQRQELSAYIAEIGRRVDAEPDLDRKVNILKEACERYPNEQQFQQSLKLTRERRDLVLSIVAKARYYEEKNLFTEAIGQWDILRNIYPRYPGIEVEVGQLVKRRDQQAKEESKARLIEQIDRRIESGDYTRARELAVSALAEYPQDQELAGLERLARQGLERNAEAQELYVGAQALFAEGKLEEATETFRRALELDPGNHAIREALLSALLEQARPRIDTDWRAAEPLVQQASELDVANPDVRSLRTQIADLKRKEFVSQCLAEARDLQAGGELESALAKVAAGLAQYPNETRLAQQHGSLENLVRGRRGRAEWTGDVEALKNMRQRMALPATVDELSSILEHSQAILRKYPDDPEIGGLAAEIQQTAGVAAPRLRTDASNFSPPTSTILLDAGPPSQGAVSAGATAAAQEPAVGTRAPETQPQPAATDPTPAQSNRPLPAAPTFVENAWQILKKSALPGKDVPWFHLAIATIVVVLLGAAVAVSFLKKKHPASPPPPPPMSVQIVIAPADATVKVNGEVKSGTIYLAPNSTYDVVVSKPGYVSKHEEGKLPAARWSFSLDPEPLRLSLSTAEKAGTVFVDNVEKGELQGGPLQDIKVSADSVDHVFAVRKGNIEVLSFGFTAKPGEAPRISDLKAKDPKDLIVVSSFSNEAVVYSGATTLSANLPGQDPKPIPSDGLPLHGVTSSNNVVTIVDQTGGRDFPKVPIDTGDAPVLYIGKNADVNIANLQVEVTPEAAHLFVGAEKREVPKQSKPGRWFMNLAPGTYRIAANADGYEAYEDKERILIKGVNSPLKIVLKKKIEVVVPQPKLIVAGGIPGAELLIDGAVKGTLDNSGSMTIEVSPGTHNVMFRKQYFEPSTEMPRSFVMGQSVTLGSSEAKLKEYGALQFQVAPDEARVSYRRSAQGDSQSAGNRELRRVTEGTYTIAVDAPGYAPQERNVNVSPGQTMPVEIALVRRPSSASIPRRPPDPESPFDDPSQVRETAGWSISTSIGEYIFLKTGIRQFNLDFPNPGKNNVLGVRTQKSVEWVVNYVSDKQKVVFKFDWKNKLTRTAQLPKRKEELSVTCMPKDPFQVTVSVQAHAITVASPSCDQPLTYSSDDQDLTTGKIGVKTNTLFRVTR